MHVRHAGEHTRGLDDSALAHGIGLRIGRQIEVDGADRNLAVLGSFSRAGIEANSAVIDDVFDVASIVVVDLHDEAVPAADAQAPIGELERSASRRPGVEVLAAGRHAVQAVVVALRSRAVRVAEEDDVVDDTRVVDDGIEPANEPVVTAWRIEDEAAVEVEFVCAELKAPASRSMISKPLGGSSGER